MPENPADQIRETSRDSSRYDRIKARVHMILDAYPERGRTAPPIQSFLAIIILINTVAVVVSTIPDLTPPLQHLLLLTILICLSLFTLEYILRLWSCTSGGTLRGRVTDRLWYATKVSMIIDLISIIPILFLFLFPRIPALLHLFMLLSIFKLARYGRNLEALTLLRHVLFKKREIISILVFFLVFEILFSSTIMYIIENGAQPEKFSSIPASMWWAVMTVTTVGYGDIIPVTPVGKVIAGMVTIGGVLLLALPSAILASGFMEERQKEQTFADHPGTEAGISLLERVGSLKERGLITEEEFQEYKALILPRLQGGEKIQKK